MEPTTIPTQTKSAKAPGSPMDRVRIVSTPGTCGGKPRIDGHRITVKQRDADEQSPLRYRTTSRSRFVQMVPDLNRDAKEVYLMEQFRQTKITTSSA